MAKLVPPAMAGWMVGAIAVAAAIAWFVRGRNVNSEFVVSGALSSIPGETRLLYVGPGGGDAYPGDGGRPGQDDFWLRWRRVVEIQGGVLPKRCVYRGLVVHDNSLRSDNVSDFRSHPHWPELREQIASAYGDEPIIDLETEYRGLSTQIDIWQLVLQCVFVVIGGAFVAGFSAVSVRKQVIRRRLAQGRCGSCGFSLDSIPAGVCPECGTVSQAVSL